MTDISDSHWQALDAEQLTRSLKCAIAAQQFDRAEQIIAALEPKVLNNPYIFGNIARNEIANARNLIEVQNSNDQN